MEQLRALVPHVIKSIAAVLKAEQGSRQVNVRIKALTLLKELVSVLDNAVAGQLLPLLPGLVAALGDARSNVKTEALVFLRTLLDSHQPGAFHEHVEELTTPLLACVSDSYYKIVAEALKVCLSLVRVMAADVRLPRLATALPADQLQSGRFTENILRVHSAVRPKLEAQDIDQEVKEAAILCVSGLFAKLGNHIPSDEVDDCLRILEQRLANEITRLTAVRAIEEIASSPLKLNLESIVDPAITQMTGFMKLVRSRPLPPLADACA